MPNLPPSFDRGEGWGPAMEPIEHVASRPTWYCTACHDRWPCEPARKDLVATHRRTELVMQMWVYFEAAAFEIQGALAVDLFDQFLNWVWKSYPSPVGGQPEAGHANYVDEI